MFVILYKPGKGNGQVANLESLDWSLVRRINLHAESFLWCSWSITGKNASDTKASKTIIYTFKTLAVKIILCNNRKQQSKTSKSYCYSATPYILTSKRLPRWWLESFCSVCSGGSTVTRNLHWSLDCTENAESTLFDIRSFSMQKFSQDSWNEYTYYLTKFSTSLKAYNCAFRLPEKLP